MAGPYRSVHDSELRDIFYLTPQTGRAFMFTVHTRAFSGSESPGVTAILREMLAIHDMSPAQRTQFKRHIAEALPGREQIAIRAHLISIVDRVFEEPWAYPALLDTGTCRKLYHEFTSVAAKFDIPASTAADPVSSNAISFGLTRIFKAVGAVVS